MKLAFTGTQADMTINQYRFVDQWLYRYKAELSLIEHGGCIGADTSFHTLCCEHGLAKLIEVWPSDIAGKQGKLSCPGSFKLHNPLPPLFRNQLMVRTCNTLLATPREIEEVLRSGTWATIRYARKLCKAIIIIQPDGGTSD